MVLVRMVPVLVHARKRTFFMTETTIRNTICWLFEKVRFKNFKILKSKHSKFKNSKFENLKFKNLKI